MVTKQRATYFDCIKGLLIFAVVLGHCMPEDMMLHHWIYAWHIPAFFVVNGLLLSYVEYDKRPFLQKNGVFWNAIKRIMVPYAIYGMLLLLVRWMNAGFEIDNLRWQTIDFVTLCGIGATWFLPCLFIAQILYYGIAKCSKLCNKNGNWLVLTKTVFGVLLLFAAFNSPNVNFVTFVLYRAFVAVFFLILGSCMLPMLQYINRFRAAQLLAGGGLSLALCLFVYVLLGRNDAALNVLRFDNILAYIVNAISGTVFILVFAAGIDLSKRNKIVSFFGKNSLIIMGTHQVIMLLCGIPVVNNLFAVLMYCTLVMLSEIPIIICKNWITKKVKNRGRYGQ